MFFRRSEMFFRAKAGLLPGLLSILVITSCSGPGYEELLKEGKQLSQERKYEQAMQTLNQARDKKETAQVYKEIGNVFLLGHSNLDMAEKMYLKSLEIDPEYINSMHNMGLVALERFEYSLNDKGEGVREHLQNANDWFQKVLKQNDSFLLTLVELGRYYYYMKDNDKALSYLQQALRVNRNYFRTYLTMGQIYLKGKNDIEKALMNLNEAYGLAPEEPMVNYFLSLTHLELKEQDQAEKYYNDYIRLLEARGDKKLVELAHEEKKILFKE